MSAPYDGSSVNSNCPGHELKYVTLDSAGAVLKVLGKGTLLFKFDVVAAYKQIRLIVDDWCLQGEFYTIDDGTPCYDISTAANFGAKSSGFLWEEYGSAFEFALRWRTSAHAVLRYVDDFIALIAPPLTHIPDPVSNLSRQVMELAASMGIGLDKFAQGTSVEFLGIIVDTVDMCFRIPKAKKERIISDLLAWTNKPYCTKRELDSLIGSLQYLTRVIPWGRAFLGRCIRASTSKRHPSHHINLSSGFHGGSMSFQPGTVSPFSTTPNGRSRMNSKLTPRQSATVVSTSLSTTPQPGHRPNLQKQVVTIAFPCLTWSYSLSLVPVPLLAHAGQADGSSVDPIANPPAQP